MIKKLLKNSERGQAIILIAFAFVGLIAMVGLMTDGGVLLIEYARLKRGIDAASVAAAQQFRKDFNGDDLVSAAENFLKLNQSDVIDVTISMCDPTNAYGGSPAHDASLCPDPGQPARKLVRVTATRNVDFGFMRVLGINGPTIQATSVGEAASIDLVLIMDTSLSMAYGTDGNPISGSKDDNPAACNAAGNCQPLENIKDVAREFVSEFMFFPYDRVAVVTMTSQTPGGTRDPILFPFEDDATDIDNILRDIKVYEPPLCVRSATNPWDRQWLSPSKGVCLEYDSLGVYSGVNSPIRRGGVDLNESTLADNLNDPTTTGSSNIGGSLYYANNAFIQSARQDAFWVVIMLAGGPANATSTDDVVHYPDGFCPQTAWKTQCRDGDLAADGVTPLITRHNRNTASNPPTYPVAYDADDYARDAADDLANPETGNGITIFTIGLGTSSGIANSLQHNGLPTYPDGTLVPNGLPTIGLPTSGENLLAYIAEDAGDVYDPVTGVLTRTANHGQYYFAEDPTLDLGPIFLAIAGNIFTRISQ
ncbi:MAG TPA: VWA domain-containing protein [Anaerolineales bacterium]|nr:VWA domain-containing protein [Anaerolineales bacterium]